MIWGYLHLWKPSNVQYPSLPPWLWHDKCGVHRWGAQASLDHLKGVSWKDIIRKARGSCEILADSPEHRLGTINTRKHQEFYQPTRAEDFFLWGCSATIFFTEDFAFRKERSPTGALWTSCPLLPLKRVLMARALRNLMSIVHIGKLPELVGTCWKCIRISYFHIHILCIVLAIICFRNLSSGVTGVSEPGQGLKIFAGVWMRKQHQRLFVCRPHMPNMYRPWLGLSLGECSGGKDQGWAPVRVCLVVSRESGWVTWIWEVLQKFNKKPRKNVLDFNASRVESLVRNGSCTVPHTSCGEVMKKVRTGSWAASHNQSNHVWSDMDLTWMCLRMFQDLPKWSLWARKVMSRSITHFGSFFLTCPYYN